VRKRYEKVPADYLISIYILYELSNNYIIEFREYTAKDWQSTILCVELKYCRKSKNDVILRSSKVTLGD